MKKNISLLPLHNRLPAYGLFLVIGSLITFFVLMSSPSDPENAAYFGYSIERILLGAALLVVDLTLLFLTIYLVRKPEKSKHIWSILFQLKDTSNKVLIIVLAIFLSLWILLFLPAYRLGVFASYLSRLLPILVWMAIISGVTIFILLIEREREVDQMVIRSNRMIVKKSLTVLLILFVIACFIAITGIGISYPADYWYGAGVPVLGLQIIFALLIGAFFLMLERKFEMFNNIRLDLFIFVTIWVVAAWFWGQEPLSPNYFMPDTANNIIYPYSDGATFDQGAQFALIGQGLYNSIFFDRTLYSVFLAYLHLVFGQDFHVLMAVQAALFAVIPAVIYLIGKELHSRALGVSAGVLFAIRGVNAIAAAKWIDTASPKMALTDFPTAIGISIFLLLLLKWLKEPAQISKLIWVGAVFGLTIMVRSHAFALLPVMLIFIPWVMKLRWKQAMLAGILILLGLLTVALPWELRNQSKGIPMFYLYYSRLELILETRYGFEIGAAPLNKNEVVNAGLFEFEHLQRDFTRQRTLIREIEPLCDAKICSIVNHFFHNLAASFTSFPSSLNFDDLWNTVKADTPYWKKEWDDGRVGNAGVILIIFNITMVSLGVGSIWERSRRFTLLPIVLFFAYIITNSLGFTSGGRYIAPVDWIVYLYFIAGGLQSIIWLLGIKQTAPEIAVQRLEDKNFPLFQKDLIFRILPVLASIFIVGLLVPASDWIAKPRYFIRSSEEILTKLDETGLLVQSGYSRDDLMEFLSQPNAMIREGRALYPRYYPSGDGEQDRSTYYRYLDYQRFVFTLISPYSETVEGVVIPGDPPGLSLHAADVIVLGCWNTTYYSPFIDAVVVFSTSNDGYVYNRSPGSPLQCPLQTP